MCILYNGLFLVDQALTHTNTTWDNPTNTKYNLVITLSNLVDVVVSNIIYEISQQHNFLCKPNIIWVLRTAETDKHVKLKSMYPLWHYCYGFLQ